MKEITNSEQPVAVVVSVVRTQGSVPRGPGTWMAVFPDSVAGSVGGGHLEFGAIDEARARLAGCTGDAVVRYPLGPGMGQCCGGVVHLAYRPVGAAELAALQAEALGGRRLVALFGAGHVGKALVRVLGTLPLQVTWIDSRDDIFPADVPANVRCEHSEPMRAAVDALPAGSHVLVMSFSHAEDLDIISACLKRQRAAGDLPFVGLIGSQSKWASFRQRLEARGVAAQELAHVTCPIGIAGITGKEPEVIAVAVAAQLLLQQ